MASEPTPVETAEAPQTDAGPVRNKQIQIGTVIRNEGPRLRVFLDTWLARVEKITVLDLDSGDETKGVLADYEGRVEAYTVRPADISCEAHLNTLIAIADHSRYLLRLDADETITDACWTTLAATIDANQRIPVWFIARRNFCGEHDISEMMGDDWQLRMVRGPLLRYSGEPHRYPEVLGGAAFAYFDSAAVWMEHHRTYRQIVDGNRGRMSMLDGGSRQMQEGFLKGLDQFMERRGWNCE
jgi:hypothetical protein